MRTCPAPGWGTSLSTISKSPPALGTCATFIGAIATLVVATLTSGWNLGVPAQCRASAAQVFAALGFPQNGAEGSFTKSDTTLNPPGHPDAGAPAGHTETLTEYPDSSRSIIHLEGALTQEPEGINHRSRDGHLLAAVATWVAI